MLVIGHKDGQVYRIGPDIVIRVFATGGHLKIGIEAPPDVRIVREKPTKTKECQANAQS